MPKHRSLSLTGVVAFVALLASACGTEPQALNVTGTWVGSTLLPTAYSTTLTLLQSGVTISGTMVVTGNVNQPFAATLDEAARTIDWTVFEGCEEWSGTFTVNGDGSQMSGPVAVDVSQCAGGTDSSGTMSLTKQ